MIISGNYWNAENAIPREVIKDMVKACFKHTGYEHAGHKLKFKHIKRRRLKHICNGVAYVDDSLVEIGIPDDPSIADLMATIVHELGHSCGKLDHKDMLAFEVLESEWRDKLWGMVLKSSGSAG